MLWALFGVIAAGPAAAAAIDLHPHLCIAGAPRDIARIAHGALRIAPCAEAPRTDGWTWLRFRRNPALAPLPANWRLLIDENRFQRIVVVATAGGGDVQRIDHTADAIGKDWAPGDTLAFTIHPSGERLETLAIGFYKLDGALFIRKVVALDPAAERL